MKRILLLTAFALFLGLSGYGAQKQSSKNKDTPPPAPDAGEKVPASGGAEYPIKLKYKVIYEDSSAGDVAHLTETRSVRATIKTTDAAGKVVEEKHSNGSENFVYTQTILEKPDKDKPPTRVRRQYERAEKKDDDKTTRMGFHGKTVLIEKKEGKWHFRYEDGPELALEDTMMVYRDFHDHETVQGQADAHKMLLPKKPVKVGETWPLDAETIAKRREKALLFKLDAAKAVGKGKLQRVYRQDGCQFGVLQFTIDTPIRAMGSDKADEGSRFSQKMTLDGCIDGSSGSLSTTMEENTTVRGDLMEGGAKKKGKLTFEMQVKGQLIRKDLGKK